MLSPFDGRGSRRRTCATVLAAIVVVVMAVPCATFAQMPPEPPPVPPTDGEPPAPPQTSPPKAEAAPTAAGAGARKVAGRVRGMVSDMAKKPLAGLLVMLSSRSEPGILRVTGTNEKGQYVFQELPPGSYDLKVQAPGYVDAGKEAVEIKPPFQNILDVMLQRRVEGTTPSAGSTAASAGQGAPPGDAAAPPPPVTVRGRFVNQDKQPLADVSVLFSAHEGRRIYQAFSSGDGAFEVTGIIPGLYRVIVRSPGHVPLDLKSVEILKDNGLSVSLMLVDYPLNFKAGKEPEMPPEVPRAATPPAPPQPVLPGSEEPVSDDSTAGDSRPDGPEAEPDAAPGG